MKKTGNLIPTTDEIWEAQAAEYILERIADHILQKGSCSVALSGGSTPLPVYALWKIFTPLHSIEWGKVNFFLSDERAVSVSSTSSNYGSIVPFISHLPAKLYPMYDKEMGWAESAAAYDLLLRKMLPSANGFPVFDLVLLGLGEDGHTASLFPDSQVMMEWKQAVSCSLSPANPRKRITLTLPVLHNAKELIVLTRGENKKNIMEEILSAEMGYPLELALDRGNWTWIYA